MCAPEARRALSTLVHHNLNKVVVRKGERQTASLPTGETVTYIVTESPKGGNLNDVELSITSSVSLADEPVCLVKGTARPISGRLDENNSCRFTDLPSGNYVAHAGITLT